MNNPLPPLPVCADFPSAEDLDAELTFNMRDWARKLSPEEYEAIGDYKELGGRQINHALLNLPDPMIRIINYALALVNRSPAPAAPPREQDPRIWRAHQAILGLISAQKVDPLLMARAITLSGALQKALFPYTLRCWRAAGAAEYQIFRNCPLGTRLTSKTFMSTSTQLHVARDFAIAENRIVIQVIIRADTQGAAYIHPFPEPQHDEFEILLNMGTKLCILRHDDPYLVVSAGDKDDAVAR